MLIELWQLRQPWDKRVPSDWQDCGNSVNHSPVRKFQDCVSSCPVVHYLAWCSQILISLVLIIYFGFLKLLILFSFPWVITRLSSLMGRLEPRREHVTYICYFYYQVSSPDKDKMCVGGKENIWGGWCRESDDLLSPFFNNVIVD